MSRVELEQERNWKGTLMARSGRIVCVMSALQGGIYLYWPDYQGIPAGATMAYDQDTLTKALRRGDYIDIVGNLHRQPTS